MWKTTLECNLYEANELGQVRRISNKNILKGCITSGYRSVKFTFKDGHQQRFYVHRIVAELFVENKDNKKIVNHKDGNKLNNNADNLEWCTQRENIYHYYSKIKKEKSKRKNNGKRVPVIQYNLLGEEIARFESVSDASRKTGIKIGTISYVLNGRQKHSNGYLWKRQ